MKILHFSDIHVDVPAGRIPLRDWIGKRLVGGANHALRRRRHFLGARRKMEALGRLAAREGIDVAVCTGDYTILGSDAELGAARAAIEPIARGRSFVTMPGNHDLYVPDGVRERRFEKHFGDLLGTDLPELAEDGWPAVRLFDGVAVVAVRSARPNPAPWRSSGRIEESELERLGAVLRDARLRERFVIVATHYAPRRHDGTPDSRWHGLENAEALLAAIAELPRGCLLHGHIHRSFLLRLSGVRPPILGAGSATAEGAEGIWVLELGGDGNRAIPGRYREGDYVLEPARATLLP